ncbi:hypothetical protein BV352_00228 [Pseudomonas syringae pv. actinidiae]|uniref:Uncharacterized protein n=1 Tax=Pseudomonas syringae pv. actinidiae TaxID=103796 RepID=M1J9S9_PSESF|nr:hypothetical protein [Pseudomonas syringae pv. actinidiae]AGE82439.1 hypothetical protein [Pseudomonas syringae pv. actinidiae]OSN87064.1 hypothetical protein BV352_00228 [Pseudomonas syringae pv. actinidiae]OSS10984.1 hypothetical protein BV333_00485 [Pseudomonas syringae pv. actinidiae]OSS15207.1 hypothetical protein BV334_00671 [Pseudomonas syringae pv. actinidiae]
MRHYLKVVSGIEDVNAAEESVLNHYQKALGLKVELRSTFML